MANLPSAFLLLWEDLLRSQQITISEDFTLLGNPIKWQAFQRYCHRQLRNYPYIQRPILKCTPQEDGSMKIWLKRRFAQTTLGL